MDKIFRFKPIINKKNGQINISLRKGDLPIDLRKAMKKNPKDINCLKMKFEGFE